MILAAFVILALSSFAGLLFCWRKHIVSLSRASVGTKLSLYIATCISVLPIAFYFLAPAGNAPGHVKARIYTIVMLTWFSLAGCLAAITLYMAQPRRPSPILFCASTIGATFATFVFGIADMGVGV